MNFYLVLIPVVIIMAIYFVSSRANKGIKTFKNSNVEDLEKMANEIEQLAAQGLSRKELDIQADRLLEKYGLKDYMEEKRKKGLVQADKDIRIMTGRIERKPGHWQDYYTRAKAYMQKGQGSLAIADWTQVIALKADFEEAYYLRSIAHFYRMDYDNAYSDACKVREYFIKRDPQLFDEIKSLSQKK
jgi:tetratricopeptide (TPR) repeat protein